MARVKISLAAIASLSLLGCGGSSGGAKVSLICDIQTSSINSCTTAELPSSHAEDFESACTVSGGMLTTAFALNVPPRLPHAVIAPACVITVDEVDGTDAGNVVISFYQNDDEANDQFYCESPPPDGIDGHSSPASGT
jgi:hypothetical protein